MKLSRPISLMVTMASIAIVSSLPQNPTTSRAVIGETIQHITKQLMELNTTSGMTFDTRTPPKIKKHNKLLMNDKSHPGIAEPIDDEGLIMDEANKKLEEQNYYKQQENPTTDSGLSTWILLSGQRESSTTQKTTTTKKPIVKNNTISVDDYNKIIKPIFKRRTTLSTTKKPTTSADTTNKTISTTTLAPEKTTKLTKIKASVLNNATNNATKNTTQIPNKKTTTPKIVSSTIASVTKPTKISKKTTTTEANANMPTTTKFVKIETQNSNITNDIIESNSVLSPEAKDEEIDLPTTKKTKRPAASANGVTKKKKNKNRRKKPTISAADDRIDATNNTKLVLSNKIKGKPIGTQIYNYLSREVMPTVGVGLVGLMVTAGLASYFLYPFGPLRRSYDVDRKDKEGGVYYYKDEYSGGIAEEDAIGKVIAGMPQNGNYNYNRAQNSRNTYNANRYRQVNPAQRYQASVETVQLNPNTNYHTQMVQTQTEDVIMGSPKHDYSKDSNGIERNHADEDQRFVVGNVPKDLQVEMESATPAVVPEHGPRTIEEQRTESVNDENVFIVQSVPDNADLGPRKMRVEHGPRSLRRRRRNTVYDNEIENEILADDTRKDRLESTSQQNDFDTTKSVDTTKLFDTTTTETTEYYSYETPSSTVNPFLEKTESIIHLIKDLFYYKIRLGLELFANKTEALSRYFRKAQDRIDVTYKNIHRNYTHV